MSLGAGRGFDYPLRMWVCIFRGDRLINGHSLILCLFPFLLKGIELGESSYSGAQRNPCWPGGSAGEGPPPHRPSCGA